MINSEKIEFWVPFYVKKVPFWSPFCSKLGPLWVPFLQFLGPLEIWVQCFASTGEEGISLSMEVSASDDDELRVCKVANSKIAFYQRGANPLLYCADGDKLKSEVPIEPTLYLLFLQRTVIGPEVELTTYDSAGSLRVYLK